MTSEIEVLKFIWKHGRKSSVRLLSGSSNFGIDYTRYILDELAKKRMITSLRGKRDWFSLTPRGRKTLARSGYIQPEVRRVKKAILLASSEPIKIVLTHNLDNQVEEQKLKLGTFVEKAARSLRGVLSAFEEGRR